MAKRMKSKIAFAAVGPACGGFVPGINTYWIRSMAKYCLGDDPDRRKRLRKAGWKVVKVRVTAIGKPR